MTRLARTMPLGRSWWEASPQGPGWNTGPTCWPTPVAPSPSGIRCSQRRRWMPPSQPWMPRSKLPPEHIVPTSTYLPMHFPSFPQVPHISVYSRRTPQLYICPLHPPPLPLPPFKRSIDTIQHDGKYSLKKKKASSYMKSCHWKKKTSYRMDRYSVDFL